MHEVNIYIKSNNNFYPVFSSARILSEKNEVKKDDADASIDNESNSQNKVYDVESSINVMKEYLFF